MKTLTLVAANRRDYVYVFGLLRVRKKFHRSLRLDVNLLRYWRLGAMQNSHPFPAGPSQAVNEKYRRKYRRLKRWMKNLIFENAALCDHVAQIQENILLVKEERRYLLKKLLEHENDMEAQLGRPCGKLNELIANSLPPKRQYKKRTNNDANATDSATKGKNQTRKPRANSNAGAAEKNAVKKSAQGISLGQSGHPNYPITIGGFTIFNLGEIAPERTAYNTEYTIYPIGYTVTRPYGHLKDPQKKCTYTCRVVDNGDAPKFEIIPENDAELAITANSTDACHFTLLQCINASLDCRSIDGRPSGDWFFGLSHPTISSLIQSFPSSKKCINYKGIKKENFANIDKENDPTLNYEALQRHITISAYHTVPEIKEEPPDELLDHSDGNSFSLS
ncbi:transforming growth factor beta regulator 1 [Toxorhynchites rutilus septentrionalis]|uniref:transforming growth factor beta regulator 1 n=1 Tax=Toxorhynchites rutilus septentrionalis TaxID=329112 RepID=UPI00247ACB0E|nr:transforming growth factor beta regulator 1 [Toxorhynchites rutilus septentrionalis]